MITETIVDEFEEAEVGSGPVFDLATGKLVGTLSGADDNDEAEFDDEDGPVDAPESVKVANFAGYSKGEFEADGEELSELKVSDDVDVDVDVDVDEIDDIIQRILHSQNALSESVNIKPVDKETVTYAEQGARRSVSRQPSVIGVVSGFYAQKIADRRYERGQATYENKLAHLEEITKKIMPKNFNPKSAASLKRAEKHFLTPEGKAQIKEVKAAFKGVIDSSAKILKSHRTGSVEASANRYQEQVLKGIAHYIDDHEKLLKTMKEGKDSDKTVFDNFKGSLGSLFDLAKILLAKAGAFLKVNQREQGVQEKQVAQSEAKPKSNAPRMG